MIARGNGTLFPLPEDAGSDECIKHYLTTPEGWSVCPSGYAVYSRRLPMLYNWKLVVAGLKTKGICKRHGRSDVLSLTTDPAVVEKYVSDMTTAFLAVEQYFGGVLNSSVHEVRGINTDIKSASEDILHYLENYPIEISESIDRVKNIKALSEILSARTDFLDYFANPNMTPLSKGNIYVYRKFDKTIQSLRPRAKNKDISIEQRGNSVGAIRGSRVFEVIPYLLVENAIKYSPRGRAVTVEFTERSTDVIVRVRNLGPLLTKEEIGHVFESGFRGSAAVTAKTTGSGIGLFFLKDLVERVHGGKLLFTQSDAAILVDGVPYAWVEASVVFLRVA